ncbi:allantoicase [Acidithiobacillus sp. IBUN Pt1247-S3]
MDDDAIISREFERFYNVADSSLGAAVVEVTDEFFGRCENLIAHAPPKFDPDLYDDHGKVVDGWETRRRRGPGHDYCEVKLAALTSIKFVEVDTRFFTGNSPRGIMIEGNMFGSEVNAYEYSNWFPIVDYMEIEPNTVAIIPVDKESICSHVKLNIFPDGGVARLRVYGEVKRFALSDSAGSTETDLASMLNGAQVLAWSDAHYGHPRNMLLQTKPRSMADGWETRRRREPGFDWCIIKLGQAGCVERIELDTTHFKGNYPESFEVLGAYIDVHKGNNVRSDSMFWTTLLPRQVLGPDQKHCYCSEVKDLGTLSHVRLNIFPDGGVSRFRAYQLNP